MTTNLLLLDLDGTVRRAKNDPLGFINSPEDQELIPEAKGTLKHYAANGFTIVGCSNQGGVECGHKTIGSAIDEMFYTLKIAPQLDAILFCPKMDGSQVLKISRRGGIYTAIPHNFQELGITSFRKPEPGMLKLAMLEHHASAETTLFVGDRAEDEQAAQGAGVNFMPALAWWGSELTRLPMAA